MTFLSESIWLQTQTVRKQQVILKLKDASQNAMLTYPGFNHKTGSVLPSLTSHQLKRKPSSPGTAGKYRQVCVWACVCVSSGRKREKKTLGWEWRRGEGGWGGGDCLAQHFFAHSPDKGLSVLLASHSEGDALMIARCLSQGSRLNFSRPRSSSPWLFLFTSASLPGSGTN